jgi:hypothetical protein
VNKTRLRRSGMRKIFAIFSNIKVDASGANAPFQLPG